MNRKFCVLLLLFVPVLGFAQEILEKRTLLDGKIELLVPKEFKVMTAEMVAVKYPATGNRPGYILTDEEATVNIAFSQTASPASQETLTQFKDLLVASLTKAHPDAEGKESGIRVINGRKVGFAKMTTKAIDQKVFNYLFFTDVGGRLLVCSFNCTEKLFPVWSKAAEEIVSSLKVK